MSNCIRLTGALIVLAALMQPSAALAANNSHKQKAIAWLFGPATMKGWVQYDDRMHGGGDLFQRVRVHIEGGATIEVQYQERYKHGTLSRRFHVEIQGASPGESFDVYVADELVGTAVADEEGEAGLQLRTGAHGGEDGDGPQPLPDTFPSLHPGDSVLVGGITVSLNQPGDDDGDGGG